jgi:predicted transposase/invertase (TIGR01784 family)
MRSRETNAKAMGKEEGIAIGKEEGKQEGIAIGEERGVEQGLLKTASNLLSMKMSVEQVSQATGLSVDKIKSLQK